MPADLGARLEQRDVMSPQGRHAGHLQPRRPTADHGDTLGFGRGPKRALTPPLLPAHRRVHDTVHAPATEARGKALVGAHATHDLLLAPLERLADQERVGHVGAHHRHHVGGAGSDHPLGGRQIQDAPGQEDLGPVADDLLGAPAVVGEERLRHRTHGRHRVVEAVVAAAGDAEEVEEAGAGEDVEVLLGQFRREPGVADVLVEGEAHADRVAAAHLLADALADLDEQLGVAPR